ncbi:MAG: gliding motility-associated C-terminal domain-containing protein [Bacteroidia bacterium]
MIRKYNFLLFCLLFLLPFLGVTAFQAQQIKPHASQTVGSIYLSEQSKRNHPFTGSAPAVSWIRNVNSLHNRVFIENKGQLEDLHGIDGNSVLYSFRDGVTEYFFTRTGVTYRISKMEKATDKEWKRFSRKNNIKNEEGEEEDDQQFITHTADVSMTMEGADARVEIKAEEEQAQYFNYMFLYKQTPVIAHARAFKKITYKNIYAGIDMVFTIHPEAGIKYTYYLHPGADPSSIRMHYTGASPESDAASNILLKTPLGTLTDHAPVSHYETEQEMYGKALETSFRLLNNQTVGFSIAQGLTEQKAGTLVIDPWTVGPPIAVHEAADDVTVDAAGNSIVYSIDTTAGGRTHITKFNSSGVQQWTLDLITKFGYNQTYQGDVAADPSGNIYITIGLGNFPNYYNTVKVDPTGTTRLWGAASPGSSTTLQYETWNISFNCDYTKLIQSGGGTYNGVSRYHNLGDFESVNTANGAESAFTENDTLGDIIATFWAPNGNIYHLCSDSNYMAQKNPATVPKYTSGAHNTLVCYNPSTGTKLFTARTGYSFRDFDKKAPNSPGMNALTASCAYVYTTDGLNLDQWDAGTGAHLHHTTITGGQNVASNGSSTTLQVNGGLVVDKCGNVFAGSNTNIYEYDPNLNLLNTISGLPDMVFDLAFGSNGVLYACGGVTDNTSFVAAVSVAACTPPGALTVAVTQPLCASNLGAATANPTFCGAPYIYSWSNGQTTQSISNLTAGSYTVVVKGSLLCPTSAGDTVIFTISAPPSALTAGIAHTNITCNAACNGTATVTPSGGTTGYTYSWTGGGGTGSVAGALCPNTYTCTITDAHGCTTTQTATITQPAALTFSAATVTNLSCNGTCNGSATVNPSGGTAPYTYSWSPSGGTGVTAGSLCAGTFTCHITDANACTTAQVINITQPAVLSETPAQTNISCNAACNGIATVNPSGGTGPYSYSWTGSASTASSASSLCPGSYTCTVTDNKGCSTTQPFSITQPAVLAITPGSATSTSCTGNTGTASVSVTGGTSAYTYSWNPAPGGGQGTPNATGLAVGSYTLTVTDANACTKTYSVSISATNAPAASLLSSTNPVCNSACTGSAAVSTSGGTGSMTYSWSPSGGNASSATSLCAGTYTCHVTDANGCQTTQTVSITQPSAITASMTSVAATCNASNGSAGVTSGGGTGTLTYSWSSSNSIGGGQGTNAITGLAAGTYTVTVTDGSACTKTGTVVVNNNGAPSSSATMTNPSCNASCTGSITVSTSGGTGPYTYSWSSGGSSNSLSSLCSGIYTCYIRDANNCLTTQTDTIKAPAALVSNPAQNNLSCNAACTGNAIVAPTGGTGPYTYSWNTSVSTAPSLNNLCSGTYSCTITDSRGCSSVQSFNITQPSPLSVTPTQTNLACNGTCNGSATALGSGGTGPYTYSWQGPVSASSSISSLCAGSYSCTVTDASGCTTTQAFSITQPPLLTASGNAVSCTCQQPNGSAHAAPSGGSGTYTYSWSPSGGSGPAATALDSGVYICTVKDSLGCSVTIHDTVRNSGYLPNALILASGPTVFCAGGNVTLTASGGGTYSWSNGQSTNSITVNTGGVYTVSVTNACGTVTRSDTVKVKPLPVPLISGLNKLCAGSSTILTASGGTSYSWSTGGLNDTIHVSNPGIYTVTATNPCGSVSTTDTVKVNTVTALFHPDTTSGTAPLPVLFTNLSTPNATTFSWNFGDGTSGNGTTPTHTYGTGGTFTVTLTVTDANGCTSVYVQVIVVKDIISWIVVPNVFTPNGDGSNDLYHVNYQGIAAFNMKIYDRWGVMIAQLVAPGQTWDGYTIGGVMASDGTYYYILNALGTDGKSYNQSGFIQLIRN